MNSYYFNRYGETYISNAVITDIVSDAVMSTYGIVGLAFRSPKEGFMTLLGRDNISKGVQIHHSQDGVDISLDVIVEYGVSIQVITQNIIENVRFKVEDTTGLKVSSINVYVHGVRS